MARNSQSVESPNGQGAKEPNRRIAVSPVLKSRYPALLQLCSCCLYCPICCCFWLVCQHFRGQWLNCYCILHLLLRVTLSLFFSQPLLLLFRSLCLLVLASTFGVNWQLLLFILFLSLAPSPALSLSLPFSLSICAIWLRRCEIKMKQRNRNDVEQHKAEHDSQRQQFRLP